MHPLDFFLEACDNFLGYRGSSPITASVKVGGRCQRGLVNDHLEDEKINIFCEKGCVDINVITYTTHHQICTLSLVE